MATTRQRDDVLRAGEIQSKAAVQLASRTTAIGLGMAIIAHRLWPFFRRQTLAFKGFLVSGLTIVGLVFGAEGALLQYEAQRRKEENVLRREARIDLARQGLIGTESEIARWKKAKQQMIQEKNEPSTSTLYDQ